MATLTLRIPKGSPLTNAELDENFAQLDTLKIELGGDIGGTTAAPVVVSLRGRDLSSAAPTTGQALIWTGLAWQPQTPPSAVSGTGVTVVDDISNNFNNRRKIFTLKIDRNNLVQDINYKDARDLLVIIDGRPFTPDVPQTTNFGPWIVDYEALRTYTYKMRGAKLILYREPRFKTTANIRINNISSVAQTRSRYPFTPNTIVFGD
jgi:hypothetical protein